MKNKCSKCGITKTVNEFGKCNSNKSGIKYACKECCRSAGRKYAAKKRKAMSDEEKKTLANKCKAWRKKKLEENPEFYKERYYKDHKQSLKIASNYYYKYHNRNIMKMRKWRQDNLFKMRNISNNWKKNNKDRIKKYVAENRDTYNEHARRRRALKRKAIIGSFNINELDQRMSVFGYQCAYCGGPFEHVDHVKPLSKGGPHCLANLRPACVPCNLSKHTKKLYKWLNEVPA